ncbi:Cysteine-rich membrane protein 2 [Spironucleus salmonicida]|uniref:Cysteine-rich membrane protein 2 n=1 Tax=Spironucleus salmonicida TaxID=348837 RepID=V6LUP6_9EUKA|nr:Cysteine-rich membrane protein 2 [Spironucleus salmonicida]|eukprot:EST44529.1 Cysteine-rich membrane protein 2 [Spironucleus salmonicida]
MTDFGMCTKHEDTCKAGSYCPATDFEIVRCLPCTEHMTIGHGCYCNDNKLNQNCQECTGTICTKCILGSYIDNNVCKFCQDGCGKCSNGNTCEQCSEGFVLDEVTSKCTLICISNKECQHRLEGYCDTKTSRCVACDLSCNVCSSATFCNACDDNDFVTTINGTCVKDCFILKNGQYCDDGTPKECIQGVTSACQCNNKMNCATCKEDFSGCATCMPFLKMDSDGKCIQCVDGYEKIGIYCQPSEQPPSAILSTGIIVTIVVIVMIAAGLIGCGIFILIWKNKQTATATGVVKDHV